MAADKRPQHATKGKPGALIQLFGLVILPITVLLLLLSFGSVYVHQSAMRSLVGERDQRAVQTSAGAIREDLDHQIAIANDVLQAVEGGANPQETLDTHELLLDEFDAQLAIFHSNGDFLASNASREFWQQLAILRESLTGEPRSYSPSVFRFKDSGEVLLVGSARSIDGGLFILGAFSIDSVVERHLADLLAQEALQAYLFSQDGDPLFAPSPVPAEVEQQVGLLQGAGSFEYEREGQQIVAAYSTIDSYGWTLVVEEPWDTLLSPLLTYTELGPLVLVPLVLLAVGIAWFALRQLVTPLRALEAHTAAMTRGDYRAIQEDVGGIAEISRLQRSLMYLAEKVDSAQQNLRSYVGAITKGQEEERMRLAHELHDDTIQSLIALNQRIQMAQSGDVDQSPLAELGHMTEQAIEDLRRLTGDLRPLYLEDLGLSTALEMLAQEGAQASGVAVEFDQQGRQRRLNPDVELALYRISQEALNNSLQHGGATRVEISLSFADDQVDIRIVDDGQGFQVPDSPAEFAPHGHFGLLGMHERAELVGARLQVTSQSGQGTEVHLALPPSLEKDTP